MAQDPRVKAAFHEVFTREPSTVKRANVSEARKAKMRVAIALKKSRVMGARIPPPKAQGNAQKT